MRSLVHFTTSPIATPTDPLLDSPSALLRALMGSRAFVLFRCMLFGVIFCCGLLGFCVCFGSCYSCKCLCCFVVLLGFRVGLLSPHNCLFHHNFWTTSEQTLLPNLRLVKVTLFMPSLKNPGTKIEEKNFAGGLVETLTPQKKLAMGQNPGTPHAFSSPKRYHEIGFDPPDTEASNIPVKSIWGPQAPSPRRLIEHHPIRDVGGFSSSTSQAAEP